MTAAMAWASVASKGNEFVTYCFGYLTMVLMLLFICIGSSLIIIYKNVRIDFEQQCNDKMGIVWDIEAIY